MSLADRVAALEAQVRLLQTSVQRLSAALAQSTIWLTPLGPSPAIQVRPLLARPEPRPSGATSAPTGSAAAASQCSPRV